MKSLYLALNFAVREGVKTAEKTAQLEEEKKPHCERWKCGDTVWERNRLQVLQMGGRRREKGEYTGITQGKRLPKVTDWENKRG